MYRATAIAFIAALLIGGTQASAQENIPGPGSIELTAIPGGVTFFQAKGNSPSFKNYTLGGALTYNINRIFGVEGEVTTSLGISQDLSSNLFPGSQKTPNVLNYTGNVVVSLPTDSSFVPYVTGGIGAMTLYSKPSLGINSAETLLTGNVGGGVKWYAPGGNWGVRGDYRFIASRSKDDATTFYGQQSQYGHRVYGALIVNLAR